MSYRESLSIISKKKYKKHRKWSNKKLFKKTGFKYIFEYYYEVLNLDTLHKFGNGESVLTHIKYKKAYFNKIKQNEDDILYILNKKGAKEIIEYLKNRYIKYSEDKISLTDKKECTKKICEDYIKHLKREKVEWESILNLDLNDDRIFLDSWLINYDIFNLVYIYKYTDWKKECWLIYRG